MPKCNSTDHVFEVRSRVHLYPDQPGQGNIQINGECMKCGLPLMFKSGLFAQTPIGVGVPPSLPLPGQPKVNTAPWTTS